MIRFFDILFSFLGILLLSPIFLILYVLICLESKGGGFYCQLRVGRYGRDFYLYKFRSLLVVTMMTIRLMTAGRLFLRLIRQKH